MPASNATTESGPAAAGGAATARGTGSEAISRRPDGAGSPRVVLRLFAAARLAAGTGRAEVTGPTVGAVLAQARSAYGPEFAAVLASSRVWCNGEPAELGSPLRDGDEVAVLPPVSGGDGSPARP